MDVQTVYVAMISLRITKNNVKSLRVNKTDNSR